MCSTLQKLTMQERNEVAYTANGIRLLAAHSIALTPQAITQLRSAAKATGVSAAALCDPVQGAQLVAALGEH